MPGEEVEVPAGIEEPVGVEDLILGGRGRAKPQENLEKTGEHSGLGIRGRMGQTQRKSGRGRSCGRGRGRLVPEESAEARQAAQENQLQVLVVSYITCMR